MDEGCGHSIVCLRCPTTSSWLNRGATGCREGTRSGTWLRMEGGPLPLARSPTRRWRHLGDVRSPRG